MDRVNAWVAVVDVLEGEEDNVDDVMIGKRVEEGCVRTESEDAAREDLVIKDFMAEKLKDDETSR